MAKGKIYTSDCKLAEKDLINKLQEAVANLIEVCKPRLPIRKGGHVIGSGIKKSEKAIAADAVISIAKEIKAIKAWD